MSENVPATGPGSLPGKRWFIHYASGYTVTVKPEDHFEDEHRRIVNQKPRRLLFQKQTKLMKLRGTGELGKNNGSDGTDKNKGILWSVYATDVQSDIDHLRTLDDYKRTAQNNRLDRSFYLKELDWDPNLVRTREDALMDRRHESVGPEDIKTQPPEDETPSPTKARVGLRKVAA